MIYGPKGPLYHTVMFNKDVMKITLSLIVSLFFICGCSEIVCTPSCPDPYPYNPDKPDEYMHHWENDEELKELIRKDDFNIKTEYCTDETGINREICK